MLGSGSYAKPYRENLSSGSPGSAGGSSGLHYLQQASTDWKSVFGNCHWILRWSVFQSSGLEPRHGRRLFVSGGRFPSGSGLSALPVPASGQWKIGPDCAEGPVFLHHFVFAGGGDLDGALCQPADREIVLKKYNAKITTC